MRLSRAQLWISHLLLVLLLLVSACAEKRPVLYPNELFKKVGKTVAQKDIDECLQKAKLSGLNYGGGERVLKRAAGSAAIGAAAGAATGAVLGNAGRGAAVGAAGGAATGATRGVLSSAEPDPLFRNFVDKCLRDKGYEPIGWR
ncbi:MAG: hypothetical protein JRJ12_04715 [Deltaproteobacteria bacterium]|nr:hypothetical protein [Deltaproteobacteria bacterium]MBW2070440.1 hypothetical protein [Deltaproteobacteria bacterium]